jgi:ABC-type Na+ efflux pump permease subunit
VNLRIIGVIARKEFRDVLRDRRTLIFMMLLPIVVMPLLMVGLTKFVISQKAAKEATVVRIAADGMTQASIRSLRDAWYEQNVSRLLPIIGKLGLSSVGNVGEMLGGVIRRVEDVEAAEEASDDSGDGPSDEALAAAMEGFRSLDEDQLAFLSAVREVGGLFDRMEFVDPDELSGEGQLAQGVEIPEDAPELFQDPKITLAIQNKDIHAALHLPADALVTLDESPLSVPFQSVTDPSSGLDYSTREFALLSRTPEMETVPLYVLYDASISLSDEARGRVSSFVRGITRFTLDLRLDQAELPVDFPEPLALQHGNVATDSREVQAFLGGLLPYMLLAFCFFGALYPALDVTAGEKERFTLETLLLGPVSRFEIAVGKFVVVFVAAIVAAVLTTASMVVTFTHGILPAEVMQSFEVEFQPMALVLTASLVLPVAALYASSLLAVGLYARSFKEAQSYTVPLQFVFVLPTLVSMIPDVEAESHLAWIPFVNISILMKELLKGNYLWGFYGVTLLSTLALTLAALWICSWLFRRESVLLRA